jgi:hydroxymethylpyrimidine/phosphomethylpyrimidine kinase
VRELDSLPLVLVFAGNDPTGGAGLTADTEALASQGCHTCPVVTALTVQDSGAVHEFVPVDAALVVAQARAVLEDLPVAAVKIGMLGSIANAQAVHSILADYPELPVVLDPVLHAGGGGDLAEEEMPDALRTLLIPQATLVTPNRAEARALAPMADTPKACAHALLDLGCGWVLVTGADEGGDRVENYLYGEDRHVEVFTQERLHGSFHGSGCTLAGAAAGLLAQGLEPPEAVRKAQDYTWRALQAGGRPGMGQYLPDRLYWARGR